VPFLDRYPTFKKVFANQYQAILLGGAAAFSAVTLSPLPLLLLAGAELMVGPFLFERVRRLQQAQKKLAERQSQDSSQEQRYEVLRPEAKARFARVHQLCERIQSNYRGLSPESQGVLAEQGAKFEAIQANFLRHLWLVQKYEEMIGAFDEAASAAEIDRIQGQLAAEGLEPRVREALETNLEIREQLLLTVRQNAANRRALLAELDSLEALLQLLLQKSIAATDAAAFSLEIDDVLARAQADAASVEEMERLVATMPDVLGGPVLSEKIKQASAAPAVPPPPPPAPSSGSRGRERESMRRR
jgi:hypothetical protein